MKNFYSLILGTLFTCMCAGSAYAGVATPDQKLINPEKISLSEIQNRTLAKTSGNFATIVTDQDAPITEPKGEATTFLESGKGWMNYMGIMTMQVDFSLISDIYFDGNDVYFKNPISQFATNTYMKGTLNGDQIVCKFPQLIYQEESQEDPGTINDYFITRLNGVETTNDYGYTVWQYSAPETGNEIVYNLVNGKWVMDSTGFDVIIALVDDEYNWVGFGDCAVTYSEFNETPLEAPAGLTTEEWVLSADGLGHMVNVGFDGNDVYIQGICTYIPDAWVKGEVKGDQVVFKGGQYMGSFDAPTGFYLAYLVGGEFNGEDNYYILPELTFSYDANAKKMDYEYTMFVNSSPDYIRYLEMYDAPVIRLQPETFNPTPEHVTLDTFNDSYGYYSLRFNLPSVTTEGYILDTDNIYWRLLLDGEVFEFDEETYGDMGGNQTEVPYDYVADTYEIYGSTNLKTFFLYVEGFDVLSIQSLYKDGDKTYYAEAMNLNVITNEITYGSPTKVSNISDAALTGVEYYNLNGQKVNNPEKGIYLKRATYSNGEVVTSKVVRR